MPNCDKSQRKKTHMEKFSFVEGGQAQPTRSKVSRLSRHDHWLVPRSVQSCWHVSFHFFTEQGPYLSFFWLPIREVFSRRKDFSVPSEQRPRNQEKEIDYWTQTMKEFILYGRWRSFGWLQVFGIFFNFGFPFLK